MSSPSYSHEAEIAQLAVQRAAILTKQVFLEKLKGTISKDDASPVTIGDFGAQALIIHALRHNFPDDQIVGEEEADSLRTNSDLCEQIWQRVRTTHLTDTTAEASLGGPIPSITAMLDAIDEGNSSGGSRGRIWALDPIDGTKGFLRGGQYAVCLALMVDGEVKVGVLGCPNLPVDDSIPVTVESGYNQTSAEGNGVLIAAVAGQGATSRPLSTASLEPSKTIRMRPVPDIKLATFCESVETGHSSHGHHHKIASNLGVTNPSVRMDSQAKYACLARGAADIYLRLSVRADYQEKIWDHAPGYLIVTEAGGTVTDFMGRKLDFSLGRTLAGNKGIVAASQAVHSNILNVVQSVLTSKV